MTARTLALREGVRGTILAHAREGANSDPPREVCGVLAGRRTDDPSDDATVESVRRVPNVAANPRVEYELDPEETLRTIEAVESEGRDVVGFYHSHPESDPVPSETDKRRATWTGYVYLICAPDGRMRAHRWTGAAFERLRIEA
ncbi:desampylase [Halopelagius longus]|uniref:Peptidase n=1 Tax=Halopelagius longus TaxID=1236180 RepID=A0A1H0YMI5_9EURY|nr:desampylase [Halopelagius longus]RDI72573.1 peptidase [Halopelagius longus]SDQ16379.1 Proteasome lid subunit RPN8/RPN11, contains Jab1/MPN metalloenzyme (JAMM) motif [Halopelagius longus]